LVHYKPKDMNEVRSLLGGIDGDVPVTLTPGVQLPPTVRTLSDLLVQSAWPEGHRLVVERYPFKVVRVELP
jgi:hypothetical protein